MPGGQPLQDFGQKAALVQPTSVVRATKTSFQVRWTEQTFERGALSKTERWTAIMTLKRQKRKTRAQLERNPLGLYVDGVDWAHEADGTPAAAPAALPAPPSSLAPATTTAAPTPSPLPTVPGEPQPGPLRPCLP